MPTPRVSYARLIFWLLFYAGLLPYALPACLDWLSRASNWWLGWGAALALLLLLGVGVSLYQAGRWLARYFSSSSSLSDD